MTSSSYCYCRRSFKRTQGFTLIELMVALLLGTLVVAAAIGIMSANRRTYGTTQSIGTIQEAQRTAFTMLTADIRSAGDFPCTALGIEGRVVAQVDSTFSEEFFERLRLGLFGQQASALDNSAGVGDAITVYLADIDRNRYLDSARAMGYQYAVTSHDKPNNPLTIKGSAEEITLGSHVAVCNADRAVVFKVQEKRVDGSGNAIIVQDGSNACGGSYFLYDPTNRANLDQACSKPTRNRYCFGPDAESGKNGCDRAGGSPAFIVDINKANTMAQWIVRRNGRGGSSLYRRLAGAGDWEEVVAGVMDMQLRYRLHGETEYKTAAEIGAEYTDASKDKTWGRVDSVYLRLTFAANEDASTGRADTQGTDGNRLERVMESYVAIRNIQRNQKP